MSRIFDFKKRFGKTVDLEEIKKDFLNKIKYHLIDPLDKEVGWYYSDHGIAKPLFDFIAIEFNHDPARIIKNHNQSSWYNSEVYRPSLNIFAGEDFEKTLLLVEILYEYTSKHGLYNFVDEKWPKNIDLIVKHALTQPISVGVSWHDGKFYPEGAEEFDEKLISDVLKWLETKPKIQALYKNALDHYSQSLAEPIKRKDVISNAFQAVEKFTQEFLSSTKPSFDNNFNDLLKKLDIDKEWGKIFNAYKELSKEFGRHGGNDDKFIPKQEDTEAFLYLSGLVLRLMLQKVDQ